LKFFSTLRGLPVKFKRYLRAVGLFGVGDFSHSLLILAATQLLTPSLGLVKAAQVAGLFYVARNLVQVATSYPVGVLADRFGALRVLVFGYVLGGATAMLTAIAFVLHTDSLWLIGAIFAFAGLYMAVQEALEATVTAELVDEDVRAMSYGALGTVNGGAKFISSTAVGLVWTALSPIAGFGLAALLMAAGTVAMARVRGNGHAV
jgi:MFS family permease